MVTGAIALTEETLDQSPTAPGTYFLYRGDELTYVGLAEQDNSVRAALEKHHSGACAGCEQKASAFAYELSHDPRRHHRQYLMAYRERHDGRVPSCNDCQPCGC